MIRIASLAIFAAVLAAPAIADSHLSEEAAYGADAFGKCAACHVVADAEGNTIAGKKAKSGPNLYGVYGRAAGSLEGFKYSKSLLAAGEAGLVWDEETLTAFIQDPTKFLRAYLDDSKARSKMSFKARADKKAGLSAEEVAERFAEFLEEVGPEMDDDDDDDDDDDGMTN